MSKRIAPILLLLLLAGCASLFRAAAPPADLYRLAGNTIDGVNQ